MTETAIEAAGGEVCSATWKVDGWRTESDQWLDGVDLIVVPCVEVSTASPTGAPTLDSKQVELEKRLAERPAQTI